MKALVYHGPGQKAWEYATKPGIVDDTRAIQQLRIAPLLHGHRNRPTVPIGTVAQLVARVGRLAATVPEIEQLDLNPVILHATGCIAVDARIAVTPAPLPVLPRRGLGGSRATA